MAQAGRGPPPPNRRHAHRDRCAWGVKYRNSGVGATEEGAGGVDDRQCQGAHVAIRIAYHHAVLE
eukprot:6722787-Alexandrium_andersonii.AAC.1